MKLQVINLENSKVGELELSDNLFALTPRADILHRMVNWQLAKRRAGTHKVKNRAEIARTSKKMYKQKGTGSARHGSARVPQFRGGGRAFGPQVRSHEHDLTKKFRRLAMRMALSSKVASGSLILLDDFNPNTPKTKDLVKILANLGVMNALIVGGAELSANAKMASGNIHNIDILPVQGANVYDILRRHTLVMTKEAVAVLEERLA